MGEVAGERIDVNCRVPTEYPVAFSGPSFTLLVAAGTT